MQVPGNQKNQEIAPIENSGPPRTLTARPYAFDGCTIKLRFSQQPLSI
jgi:hypothetical protein